MVLQPPFEGTFERLPIYPFGATRPSQTPRLACVHLAGFTPPHVRNPSDTAAAVIPTAAPGWLAPALHLPSRPILVHAAPCAQAPDCELKLPWSSVLRGYTSIFTGISISPDAFAETVPRSYAFRAGSELTD